MGARTLSVTVQFSCDSLGCDTTQLRVAEPTMRMANEVAKARGWVKRRAGFEKWECPRCARRTARLIDAGAISRDGYIVDVAKYEALTASEAVGA